MARHANSFYPGRCLVVALLLIGLPGCASINLDTGFAENRALLAQVIDQSSDRFPEIDPLHLAAPVLDLLDRHLEDGDSPQVRLEKIQQLLYGENYLNIQYSEKETHTAMGVFQSREGNCLSVMNLYVAMARYAGLDARFQTVKVQPSWDRRGDVLVISEHINATGRLGFNQRYIVDFTPEISLQQLTAATVSDRQARALFFNNLGVEAMIEGDYSEALVYYKNALFLAPDLAIAWNNIGAAYSRLNRSRLAEFSYKMAFNNDRNSATAINNLARFYRRRGDLRLAGQYTEAIRRFNERNPYYHYVQGKQALADNDLSTARLAFRQALSMNDTEPDFYQALAEVNSALGDEERAEELQLAADQVLAGSAGLYRSGGQRYRIIDGTSILNDATPGLRIRLD